LAERLVREEEDLVLQARRPWLPDDTDVDNDAGGG